MQLKSHALFAGPDRRDWRATVRRVLIALLALAVLITTALIALGALLA